MNWTKVIEFWFTELSPSDWFRKSDKTDALITKRFGETHRAAVAGELSAWRTGPLSALAEIVVLDQFSRNIFRDKPASFAADPLALSLAEAAIAKNYDQQLSAVQKSFMYMPFMHSESKTMHERAVQLFSQPGLEGNLEYEFMHKKIIDRFGRYPHRNWILGRASTNEETEFLKTSPGF